MGVYIAEPLFSGKKHIRTAASLGSVVGPSVFGGPRLISKLGYTENEGFFILVARSSKQKRRHLRASFILCFILLIRSGEYGNVAPISTIPVEYIPIFPTNNQ